MWRLAPLLRPVAHLCVGSGSRQMRSTRATRSNSRGHHEEGHSPRLRRDRRHLHLWRVVHDPQHRDLRHIHADVCSQCHPFYTGKQKILDTGGRVARFEARYAKKAPAEKAETSTSN